MVDTKSNNSLIYLPLDKLIAQTAAESNALAPASNASAAINEALPAIDAGRSGDLRGRDNRSTRDRETR